MITLDEHVFASVIDGVKLKRVDERGTSMMLLHKCATSIAAGVRCEQESAARVLAYIGRQLSVALQSGPNLRLEAAVRKHLGNQTQVTGLSCCQLLIEQQHLIGLQETGYGHKRVCASIKYSI